MAEARGEPRVVRRRGAASALASFLAYLGEIDGALLRRDALRITALLRKRTSSHLPREVREELLFIAHAPRESLRAPVAFLRFQYRMMQLAAGGDTMLTAQTELHLEEPASAGAARRREAAARQAAREPDAADQTND